MNNQTFEKFRALIHRQSGIVLPPEKKGLLESRIVKRLRALGISGEEEYFNIIELDVEGAELVNLINVISTNTTYFYREEAHFASYRQMLRELYRPGETLKVWCAASSSGEEPYTLAFEALQEFSTNKPTPVRILATDISTRVLERATQGIYPLSAYEKLPKVVQSKYVHRCADSDESFCIGSEARSLLLFKKFNLVEYPYSLKGPLDIIFCRNVMIYFDNDNRQKIIGEFHRLLRVGGYLVLSHSENLLGISHQFEKVGSSVFRKNERCR